MCLETFPIIPMRKIIRRMRGSLVMGVVKRRLTNVAITSVLLSLGSIRRPRIFKLMAGMLPFDSLLLTTYHSYSYNINTNKYFIKSPISNKFTSKMAYPYFIIFVLYYGSKQTRRQLIRSWLKFENIAICIRFVGKVFLLSELRH